MTRYRFLPRHHLRTSAQFARVYGRRRSASDGQLLLFACENDLTHARVGLSVAKKVGGGVQRNAVQRNRWKRLLREAFRLTLPQLPAGADLVLVPRTTEPPPLATLMHSLLRLSRQATKKLHRPGA